MYNIIINISIYDQIIYNYIIYYKIIYNRYIIEKNCCAVTSTLHLIKHVM